MTKANMMKEAHKLAKTFEGNYSACLALALRILNRGVVEMTVEEKILEVAKEEGLKATKWSNYGTNRVYFSYKGNKKVGYFCLDTETFSKEGVKSALALEYHNDLVKNYNNK